MSPQKIALAGLLAGIALFAIPPMGAIAQPPAAVDAACAGKMLASHHAPMPPELQLPPFLRGMKLSEAQDDRIFELMHRQVPQLRDKSKKAHQAEEELRQLALGEHYDPALARTLADRAGRAQADVLALRAEIDQQVVMLLSKAQREKLPPKFAGQLNQPN